MNFDQARYLMIEQQIRPWNVEAAAVLQSLSNVKREDFVPQAHRGLAFAEMELPLTGTSNTDLARGECLLVPQLEGRMLQDLALTAQDSVLEIGAGSGFMAALIASQARQVISLEINPALVTLATDNLRKSGVQNAEVRLGDGAKVNFPEQSFDAILLSGSVAEVPQALLPLLKIGGRLCAVVGDAPIMRGTVVTRTSATEYNAKQAWDAVAPRLHNFPKPSRFQF